MEIDKQIQKACFQQRGKNNRTQLADPCRWVFVKNQKAFTGFRDISVVEDSFVQRRMRDAPQPGCALRKELHLHV